MPRKFLLAMCIACFGIVNSPKDVQANSCGPPAEIPKFSETLDPNSAPKPPAECASLRLYGANLEIFLNNTVERYNKKLIAFGETLNKADESYRKALKNGTCTAAQYEALKEGVQAELEKMRSEYLESYNESIFVYKQYINVLKIKTAQCVLAGHESHEDTRLTSIIRPN